MTMSDSATLYTLGDRGQTIDGAANDVRGRHVKDKDGDSIGKVVDLLVDDQEKKVRFLLVEHGGFLGLHETKTLLPVDAISKVTENDVFINQPRATVASAPGYSPHWSMTGRTTPASTTTTGSGRTGDRAACTPCGR